LRWGRQFFRSFPRSVPWPITAVSLFSGVVRHCHPAGATGSHRQSGYNSEPRTRPRAGRHAALFPLRGDSGCWRLTAGRGGSSSFWPAGSMTESNPSGGYRFVPVRAATCPVRAVQFSRSTRLLATPFSAVPSFDFANGGPFYCVATTLSSSTCIGAAIPLLSLRAVATREAAKRCAGPGGQGNNRLPAAGPCCGVFDGEKPFRWPIGLLCVVAGFHCCSSCPCSFRRGCACATSPNQDARRVRTGQLGQHVDVASPAAATSVGMDYRNMSLWVS
jgi:hypothetical protein